MTAVETEIAKLDRMGVPQLRRLYADLTGDGTSSNNRAWLLKRIAWRLQADAQGGLSERAAARAAELARESDLRLMPPKEAAAPTPKPETKPAKVETSNSRAPVNTQVAKDADHDDRLPPVGNIITRPYKGTTIKVKVLADGFEYEKRHYASLSAVAKAVTGSHCNGFLFFRLNGKGGAK